MAFVTVARLGELKPGELKAVSVNGLDIVLYRCGDRHLAAQRYCIHQNADLAEGHITGNYLVCPRHGWRFHVETGRYESSPSTCLRTFAVRVHGDDIQLDPEAFATAQQSRGNVRF